MTVSIRSEKVDPGFRIKGIITVPYLETCDRCLSNYENLTETNFEIWLYSDARLIEESNQDAIYFPENMNSMDLSGVIEEFIELEILIKRFCSSKCKGLCTDCGANLNEGIYNCRSNANNNAREALT